MFRTHSPFDAHLNAHAEAIGHLCIAWGRTEFVLGAFTACLIGVEGTPESDVIFASMDIRKRIEALKSIAFIKKHDLEWFNELEELLNELDNKIRPKRNRIVHDAWVQNSKVPTQVRTMSRIVKEQAFLKSLRHREETEVSEEYIWGVYNELLTNFAQISKLWFDHPAARASSQKR